ncbi:plasmid replication protein RepC (plasmid) [Paracoccus marcusii]|uniref:plasmid replication protein RepC n=1 Tax=Paracoccus marcusii TaxID=59779 RepID=UPI0038BCEE15
MTPFGRQPVTAGLLAAHALAESTTQVQACDKWALLRDLTAARKSFNLSDRDLVVLAALLSCHPGTHLADDTALIVFPSNATLSNRAHGMPESTLRRHLATLVQSGLILRRDSPNGKRYARRGASGQIDRAFGFDLRPLALRAADITVRAEEERKAAYELRCKREAVVISLRDLSKLIVWGIERITTDWASLQQACSDLQRCLRRKLDMSQLQHLEKGIRLLTAKIDALIAPIKADETSNMSASVSHFERHHQSSKKDDLESEEGNEVEQRSLQAIPLGLVLKATPSICDYAPDAIRTWENLVEAAYIVRPMLGITLDAWQRACRIMGPERAAVTMACILQRHGTILRPGGYLRSLTDKAAGKGFSPGPMVMALLRCDNHREV